MKEGRKWWGVGTREGRGMVGKQMFDGCRANRRAGRRVTLGRANR